MQEFNSRAPHPKLHDPLCVYSILHVQIQHIKAQTLHILIPLSNNDFLKKFQ